ncbi:hypothetical protein P8C59_003785 [Phyllachora maydis]|uniref:RNA polymerase III subunit C6 n=1 Tax=Phyllachora maydis TaxID=1825666 RepID=A0AAD9MDN8_9PEZI|nr:hypothetical protein P8C59_003785 [Phyllachora maydis]
MAPLAPEKLDILSDLLYDSARQEGDDQKAFTQRDLLDLGLIPRDDPQQLVQAVQALVNQRLFFSVQNSRGELAWRLRTREDASKYDGLADESAMVYEQIDNAGPDGIWSRTIRQRLRMQDSTVKAALKQLEQRGFITTVVNVEHPTKKMYIKANLRPSDRATGGPWFNEGELDTPFVAELEKVVFGFITRHSAYQSSGGDTTTRAPKKGVIKGQVPTSTPTPNGTAGASAPRGKKRPAAELSGGDGGEAGPAPAASRDPPRKETYLPLPAGYAAYPTVSDVARFIHESNIIKNTTLSEAEVQQLLDLLEYDGLIEPVRVRRRRGYRVVRPARQEPVLGFRERQQQQRERERERERERDLASAPWGIGAEPLRNGLTEAPCGRCPVFELCEVGGPVNPFNCVYFERWLAHAI